MRFKGRITKALLVALILTLIPVTAFSAQKITPGTTCKVYKQKITNQNKVYTCIKSGKKLVWNKGVQTPVPKKTPPPFQDDVSVKIDLIRNDAMKRTLTDSSTHIFIFQDGATQEVEFKTKRSLLNAVPIYNKLGFNTTDSLILVAKDMNWLKKELVNNECFNPNPTPDRPGFYFGGKTCKKGNGAVTSYHWEKEKFSDGLDGLYFNHVIPHEYFHLIIQQLTSSRGGEYPKWFWEGSAQFFTNQAWTTWNPQRSYLEWYQHWWSDLRPDLGPTACKNVTIDHMSDPSNAGMANACAYSKGQLIVEYLVSKYGLEKYRSLYTSNMDPDWRNFKNVFKQVTGEELSDFYEEAQEFITKRGW